MVMLLLAWRISDCRVAASWTFSARRRKPWPGARPLILFLICLDTYILRGVYQEYGSVRNHCGAEPPRDPEPAGLVGTVGGRDRASTWDAAADRVKAPAGAARGGFRGIHGGRTAASVPVETWTISGVRCLAGSVPPVLV